MQFNPGNKRALLRVVTALAKGGCVEAMWELPCGAVLMMAWHSHEQSVAVVQGRCSWTDPMHVERLLSSVAAMLDGLADDMPYLPDSLVLRHVDGKETPIRAHDNRAFNNATTDDNVVDFMRWLHAHGRDVPTA